MLLSVKNLSVNLVFPTNRKTIVENVSFDLAQETILALVGGSGSGKTTTGLSLMRLLAPELEITGGEIFWQGKDLLKLTAAQMRSVRGREIGMVFQEPLSAFNPVFTVGYQIEEVLVCHTALSTIQRKERIFELLRIVGINDPHRVAGSFPHQLSGGMRQRAMIAQAIAASPKLIIADEPTSNLDVTLQAHIMELFRKLQRELKLSVILITHDLGVVKHLADSVVVLAHGRVIESGRTQQVLEHPRQEYTRQLLVAANVE